MEDQKKQNEELKNFYEDLLAKEREEYELLREDRKKQKKQMDMLQNCVVQMTQTFQVREVQHSKEIDELRKALADRAKLGEDECKMTTTEIPTTTEEQQDDTEPQEQQEIQEQDEERKSMKTTEIPTTTEEQQDEDHQTTTKSVTIKEQSTTFFDSQIQTKKNEQKITTQRKNSETQEKQEMQEKDE